MAELTELETQLQLKYRISRKSELQIGHKTLSVDAIIEKLAPHVTDARKARIEQVVNGRTFSIATVVENLYDIGNVSAVMRSAESFGFLPFHIVERKGAKYKMSDRISRGSEKWLDIQRHEGPEKAFAQLRQDGFKIYATDLNATHRLQDIDFSERVAVVLGNEKEGISDYVKSNADGTFIIPMQGFAQSFNISVAAAISFFSVHSSREQKLGHSGDLTNKEKKSLIAQYYMRTLDSYEEILLRN